MRLVLFVCCLLFALFLNFDRVDSGMAAGAVYLTNSPPIHSKMIQNSQATPVFESEVLLSLNKSPLFRCDGLVFFCFVSRISGTFRRDGVKELSLDWTGGLSCMSKAEKNFLPPTGVSGSSKYLKTVCECYFV